MAAKTPGKPKSEGLVHAFEHLAQDSPKELPPVVIAIGPDDFLRRASIDHTLKLGGIDPMNISRFDGQDAQWRDVNDELSTQGLFDSGGPKAAFIRKADPFLTAYREQLERWIEQATPGSTLLLDLQTLPSNQRVYKLALSKGLLLGTAEAKGAEFTSWITQWGISKHKVHLTASQAGVIADRIGYVCGLIDCELAKLALFADSKGADSKGADSKGADSKGADSIRKVSDARVDELVGGWRTQTVWKLSEAVAEGRIAEAIEGIDKLIMSGQTAIGIAAQMSWSLRRYGVAAAWSEQQKRFGAQSPMLPEALSRAGFRPYDLGKEENRLKKMGWNRAKDILTWLVELEKELKGSHSQEDRARMALESFIFRFQ